MGRVTSVQRSASSVHRVSSVGRAFTLAASHCQSGASVHAAVGGVGIRGEQRLAFARCTKPPLPSMVPPPTPPHFCPFTLCHPCRTVPPTPKHTHTLTQSPPGAGCSSSSLSDVCMAEQWMFYPHENRNVSECSRPGLSLLSEHALCPLLPLREGSRHISGA